MAEKMTRRDIRDSAFKIIYESLLRDDSVEELFEIAEGIDEIPVNDDVKQMVTDILSKSEELDAMISQYSKKRIFSRIAKINIAILRIAFYEILYNDQIPLNAAVHEAVLIAQVPHLLDGLHGGRRGAGLVVLDDHHGGVSGEENVPKVLRDHFGGDLDAHHAGQPEHVAHPGNLLHLLLELVGILGGHVFHDEHSGGRHPEWVLQEGLALGGVHVLG